MVSSVRVAGIDCGTNSIRLMIADVSGSGMSVVVPKTMEVVRLGQDIDRTHRFDPEALERTFAASRRFAATIADAGADAVRFVATSATRDASNRDFFETEIENIFSVHPEVISGEKEAKLSFMGATQAVKESGDAPYLVVDLGGGSTELVLGGTGDCTHIVESAVSMNVGSVRMSERYLHSDPPTREELLTATEEIDDALCRAFSRVPVHKATTLIGVSGTVTTMSLLALGEKTYSREKVDGAIVSFEAAQAACERIMSMPLRQMEHIPLIHPGRRDVIAGGALIWSRLLAYLSEQVERDGRVLDSYTASERGLLDGIVLDRGRKFLGLGE